MIKLICVPNVVCYCKWFTISVLINLLCDGGAAKYRRQKGSLIYLQFFICIYYYMHLLLFFKYQIFHAEPLINTTISKCPVNFINLAAIIVAFWLSEYDQQIKTRFPISR